MGDSETVPRHPIGVFEAFKLFWIIPLMAAARSWRGKEFGGFVVILGMVTAAMLQLCFATDTSRLMGLAFPAILVGVTIVKNSMAPEVFRMWLWKLVGANFLVPTCEVFFLLVLHDHS